MLFRTEPVKVASSDSVEKTSARKHKKSQDEKPHESRLCAANTNKFFISRIGSHSSWIRAIASCVVRFCRHKIRYASFNIVRVDGENPCRRKPTALSPITCAGFPSQRKHRNKRVLSLAYQGLPSNNGRVCGEDLSFSRSLARFPLIWSTMCSLDSNAPSCQPGRGETWSPMAKNRPSGSNSLW